MCITGGWLGFKARVYGVGAAVIAISVRSAYKLVRSTLKNDWLLWSLFTALAVATAWKEAEIVRLFLLCGLISMLLKSLPQLKYSAAGVAAFAGMGKILTGGLGPATAATVGPLFLLFWLMCKPSRLQC